MWIAGVTILVLAHQNVVLAKTFMTSDISMPFDGHRKVQEDAPTILFNRESRPTRLRSSRFERLRGAEVQPIHVRPAIVEVSEPISTPIEVSPVLPSHQIEIEKPQQQVQPSIVPLTEEEVLPSKIIEREIVTPKTIHAQEVKPAKIREYPISEVAPSQIEEVKHVEHWEPEIPEVLPPIEFESEVISPEIEMEEIAVTVPTIPLDYAKLPETEVKKPIRRVYPIIEKSSKFSQNVEEETSTTTTVKPKKLKKKRKNRKSRTTTMVTIPMTTTIAPTTTTTQPTTTTEEPVTTTTTITTTLPAAPPIQIHTIPISKQGESYLGGWNEEGIKNDESLGRIMNQLSEVPSSISLTDENAVRSYYQKYYEEWYRQHNVMSLPVPENSSPSIEPVTVTPTTAPHKKINIQLGSRNQPHPTEQDETSAASNQFGIASNATVPSKEQLEKICDYVAKISKSFGIKDPVMFAKNNCAFVKNFHPKATCEQVQEVMAYCSARVYSSE